MASNVATAEEEAVGEGASEIVVEVGHCIGGSTHLGDATFT